jgi:3-methyladenine DNA glycosylase AlkD
MPKPVSPRRPSQVLEELRALADPAVVWSMARFALPTDSALGIPVPVLRKLAHAIGKNHRLALALWKTRIFEARALAPMIDEPARVSEAQMERWVRSFDSWAITDGCCFDLFRKTPFARGKALEWSRRTREFEKRAGFALMAALARHDREATDAWFAPFLAAIHRESTDARHFVKKAVNWALREIGKRNLRLNREAIFAARALRAQGAGSARWIAADALRELNSAAVQARLRVKQRARAPRKGRALPR